MTRQELYELRKKLRDSIEIKLIDDKTTYRNKPLYTIELYYKEDEYLFLVEKHITESITEL